MIRAPTPSSLSASASKKRALRSEMSFDALKAFPERLDSGRIAVATAKDALATAEKALTDAIASATEGAGEALALLEKGRDYLHAHPAVAYLTQKYECAVPRRQGAAYTLGDLLPAVSGKLRNALKVEIRDGITDPAAPPPKTVELKPILDELARIAQARNAFGAHFKAISFAMLDADAVAFAKQVEQLVDALTHPTDGWPSNDKSGSYWRNSTDSRRLHPLKKPG
jgi:hypothetical protein